MPPACCFHRLPAPKGTVDWSFGPGGCNIKVTARDGTQSVVASDMPVQDVSMTFNSTVWRNQAVGGQPQDPAPAPVPEMQQISQTMAIVVLPVEVDAFVNFQDEGTISAQWTVSSAGIRGKGRGKGIGKDAVQMNPGI